MARQKKPWCIEIEYHPEREGDERPSEFYVVRKMVADIKDLHLLVVREGEKDEKISIDNRTIAKVMMVVSNKEMAGASA